MGKTPVSVNKALMNKQNKSRSDSSTIRTSSSNSIKRTGNLHGKSTRRALAVSTNDKENVSSHAQSTSDISDDEPMECETVPHKLPRKVSPVHQFATKLSPQDYQCKLCSKVNTH